ncbi:MAG: type IV pilus assembly protein PilM [Desulfobacterales bacterium]|nr:MAG: type IV pilus assembly protein PilM [Desulfobacterales bacterium]
MVFAKKDHLIGVDIGSRAIKLSEVQQTKKGRILEKFGMANLPQNAIVEGRIKEPAAVADIIKGLISDLKVSEQNVATSVAGYSVIIKRITVGKMTDEELHENIQYEAEQYIPFDLDDVNIDFHIIGESELNPNQMNVMLVAAKTEIINEYVSLLDMASLNPCVIDIDVFALERVFEENYLNEEGTVGLIDIGANKMNINIVKGYMSAFTRDVNIGGEQITREIASRFDCSFEEAEAVKLGQDKDKVPEEDIREIVYSIISSWGAEIRRAIDFYYSTGSDEDIGRIMLSGGAAQTEGFSELLSAETSIDVQMCNPFMNVKVNEKNNDVDYLQRIAPQAAICMGLASRRVDDK